MSRRPRFCLVTALECGPSDKHSISIHCGNIQDRSVCVLRRGKMKVYSDVSAPREGGRESGERGRGRFQEYPGEEFNQRSVLMQSP